MQAELFDAALAVWASEDDPSSETGADFALGQITITPARGRPGQVTIEIIDLRERRQQWRELVGLHRAAHQPLELLAPAPVKVAHPSLRHRGPRRGHVGARRRPGARRVTASSRAGPQSSDPDLDDEHRRAS